MEVNSSYKGYIPIPHRCSRIVPYFRFCFLAKSIDDDPNATLDTDIVGAVWMTLDELIESARARSPLVIKAVQDAPSGQKYPLSLIYEHQNSPLISNLDA